MADEKEVQAAEGIQPEEAVTAADTPEAEEVTPEVKAEPKAEEVTPEVKAEPAIAPNVGACMAPHSPLLRA